MVKRIQSLGAVSLLTCTLLLFSIQPTCAAGPVTFATAYGAMEFTFPPGWFQNPDTHPYDLQCFSKKEQMNTGIFVFKKVDLAATTTPYEILQRQVADMQSKRKNFQLLEAESRIQYGGKRLTSVVYAGEKNLSRYLYRFTLVEFDDDASQFAVALQVAIPGQWDKSKPILDAITRSARNLN